MRVFVVLAVLTVLGLFVYREALSDLIASVLHRQGSSHGILVPFISGYLVWLRLEKIREATPKLALVPGTVIVGVGLLLFFLTNDSAQVALPAFSFLLVGCGLVLGLFGKNVFKELGFPLFFLVTMIPLPKPFYTQTAEWMRETISSGSVGMLQLFYFPIFRECISVSIPNMNFHVVES